MKQIPAQRNKKNVHVDGTQTSAYHHGWFGLGLLEYSFLWASPEERVLFFVSFFTEPFNLFW